MVASSIAETPVNSASGLAKKVQLEAFVPELITKLSEQNERGKIESILACDDKLLLGLSNGTLNVCTISDPDSDSPQATISATKPHFCNKSIEEMGLLKEISSLIVLSDGLISIYGLESLALHERLNQTRGATTFSATSFTLETETGPIIVSRLLVACKRRLVCYEWRDAKSATCKELHLHDRVSTITILSPNTAVCGLHSDYVIVDIPSGKINNISGFGTSSSALSSFGFSYMGFVARQSVPHSVNIPNRSVLLAKDGLCQFVNEEGDTVNKPPVSWTSSPTSVHFSYPYLIFIFPQSIEVRNPETLSLLQTLDIPDIRFFSNGKLVYVATQHEVYIMRCTDLKQQIQWLSDASGRLSEAISLLNFVDSEHLGEKDTLLRDLKIRKAARMFKDKEYVRSLVLFSEVSAPPKTVIDLFPAQISGSVTALIEALENASDSDSRRSSVSSQTRTLGTSNNLPKISDAKSQPDSPVPTSPSDAYWSSKDLHMATSALLNYLADTRRKLLVLKASQKRVKFQGVELSEDIYGDWNEAAKLVDTTLFKCYVLNGSSLVSSLLRIHNHCDAEEVTAILSHSAKWRELLDFYFAKKLHKKALELLHTLSISKIGPASLQGPGPTVRYLKRLDNAHIDLIFEFAAWPISQKESYGVDLFLADTPESESLDKEKVFKYLESSSASLMITYLEHIIYTKTEKPSIFHTALAIAYIQLVSKTGDTETFDKLTSFLTTNPTYYQADKVFSSLPSQNNSKQILEVKAILLGQLGQHTEALHIYSFQIRNGLKAKTYCSDLYERNAKAGRAALHTLMALYLTPPEKEVQRIDLALDLLASQGSRMSVVEIINTLPNSTGLKDISVFLLSQVRELKKAWNLAEIATSLQKVDLVKRQEELLTLHQRSVTINSIRTCKVCFKRLGHSVISAFPDGTAVHYGCATAYQQQLENKTNEAAEKKRKILKSNRSEPQGFTP